MGPRCPPHHPEHSGNREEDSHGDVSEKSLGLRRAFRQRKGSAFELRGLGVVVAQHTGEEHPGEVRG